jgi:deoxyribonuclease V
MASGVFGDFGSDLTPKQAMALQADLCGHIIRTDDFPKIESIAGVDVAFGRRRGPAHAAVVTVDGEDSATLEQATAVVPDPFPYVPGLLSFREAPAALLALKKLTCTPDLLLCDGQGIAHPRRFGFASHLGLVADIPSIGVGKSRLIGTYEEPAGERGAWTSLIDKGEIIGAVVRTRTGVRPLFVSTGHRVSLETAVGIVLRMAHRYRLPEPIRLADRLSKARDSLGF